MEYGIPMLMDAFISPIVIVFPDGTQRMFPDGKAASVLKFRKPYLVKSIQADNNKIVVTLEENLKYNSPEYSGMDDPTFF